MKCWKCQTDNTKAYRFCNNCGSKLYSEPHDNYEVSVKKTKVFFFVLLGYIALLNLLEYESTYITTLIADALFALIVIVFSALNFKSLKDLLIPKKINYRLLIIISVSLALLAFLVTHLSDFLSQSVFNTSNSSYYEHYKASPLPLLFCIISIGVFPAIFEEIAFRGILFNELQNIVPAHATIIITTVLFTILHFSFISFFWIFPIGFLFGYLRSRHHTLLYGIVGHFVYNTSIVLIEYFTL